MADEPKKPLSARLREALANPTAEAWGSKEQAEAIKRHRAGFRLPPVDPELQRRAEHAAESLRRSYPPMTPLPPVQHVRLVYSADAVDGAEPAPPVETPAEVDGAKVESDPDSLADVPSHLMSQVSKYRWWLDRHTIPDIEAAGLHAIVRRFHEAGGVGDDRELRREIPDYLARRRGRESP